MPPAAAAAGDSEFKKFRGLGICQLESAGATMRPAGRARLGRVFLSVSVFAASPILALGMEPGVQVLLHPSSPNNEPAFCSGNKLTAERGHADCSLHGVLPALNRRLGSQPASGSHVQRETRREGTCMSMKAHRPRRSCVRPAFRVAASLNAAKVS